MSENIIALSEPFRRARFGRMYRRFRADQQLREAVAYALFMNPGAWQLPLALSVKRDWGTVIRVWWDRAPTREERKIVETVLDIEYPDNIGEHRVLRPQVSIPFGSTASLGWWEPMETRL